MAALNLTGSHRVVRRPKRGGVRIEYYAWRGRGAPRIGRYCAATENAAQRLADADAVNLAARFKAAAFAEASAETVAGLVTAYRRSPEWKDLAAGSKKLWLRVLDRITDTFGSLKLRVMALKEVKKLIWAWRDKYAETPREADLNIQVLSRLLNWGVARGLIEKNQASDVTKLWATDHADDIWEEADLARFHEAARAAGRENLSHAVSLLLMTGLRVGDAADLTWDAVGADAIRWRTAKSQRKGKRQREVMIPLDGDLRALLDVVPRKAKTVLVNAHGAPFSTGVTMSEAIQRIAKPLGIKLRTHDLRGTAATRFCAAGMPDTIVAMIMGWSVKDVERIRARYVDPVRAITMHMRQARG